MNGVLIEARGGDRYRLTLPDGSSVDVAGAAIALELAEAVGVRAAWEEMKHPRARGGKFANVARAARAAKAADAAAGTRVKFAPATHPRTPEGMTPGGKKLPGGKFRYAPGDDAKRAVGRTKTTLGKIERARRGPKDVPADKLKGRVKDVPGAPPAGSKAEPQEPLGSPGRPVETDDVVEAARQLAKGNYVRLRSAPEVSTLLKELHKEVEAARAKGEKAPDINLCKVSVKGTNLFCVESKGIPRIQMPQLKGDAAKAREGSRASKLTPDKRGEVSIEAQFRDHLVRHGVRVEDGEELASHLKATQDELNGAKVAGIANAIDSGVVIEGPGLFVSKDNYVVDGHHRWAATVGVDYEDGKEDMTMPVQRIDMPIIDILREANAFAEEWGLPQAGVGDFSPKMLAGAPPLLAEKEAVKVRESVERRAGGTWRVTLPDGRAFDAADEASARALAEASLRAEWREFMHPRGRAGQFVDAPSNMFPGYGGPSTPSRRAAGPTPRNAELDRAMAATRGLSAEFSPGRPEDYRQRVRRGFRQMSDAALLYQAGRIVGGIDRDELEREILSRRTDHAGPLGPKLTDATPERSPGKPPAAKGARSYPTMSSDFGAISVGPGDYVNPAAMDPDYIDYRVLDRKKRGIQTPGRHDRPDSERERSPGRPLRDRLADAVDRAALGWLSPGGPGAAGVGSTERSPGRPGARIPSVSRQKKAPSLQQLVVRRRNGQTVTLALDGAGRPVTAGGGYATVGEGPGRVHPDDLDDASALRLARIQPRGPRDGLPLTGDEARASLRAGLPPRRIDSPAVGAELVPHSPGRPQPAGFTDGAPPEDKLRPGQRLHLRGTGTDLGLKDGRYEVLGEPKEGPFGRAVRVRGEDGNVLDVALPTIRGWREESPGRPPGRRVDAETGSRLDSLYDAMVRASDPESDSYDPKRYSELKAKHDALRASVHGEPSDTDPGEWDAYIRDAQGFGESQRRMEAARLAGVDFASMSSIRDRVRRTTGR